MSLPRLACLLPLLVVLPFFSPTDAFSQKKSAEPRAKKPDLPPSTLPLEFIKGERIAILGSSTAERMSLFGHFETLLHLRNKDKELVIRNFGRPAEAVNVQQRSGDYTKIDDPLFAFNPDTFLCFFGFNESFAGKDGVEKFKADYERFIDDYTARYPRDDAKSKPRFVLVSPIAVETSSDPLLTDAKSQNENLKLYADAVKAVAAKRNIAFIDVFSKSLGEFGEKPGLQFTINGIHLNDAGDKGLRTCSSSACTRKADRGPPTTLRPMRSSAPQ